MGHGTLKILFLAGFTLHNLEETWLLPAWSRHAGRFHPPVGGRAFGLAVAAVTALGYLLAFLDAQLGAQSSLVRLAWIGFVGMMGANALLPHLAATMALRRYAPGLATGLLLNCIVWRQNRSRPRSPRSTG